MKKWLWLKNKGVTLVELIVTIALMTIVGGAITSFVVVSQRNYNSGSAETDLQYEVQMVSNQLQDLLIDTARGVSYTYNSQLADGSVQDLYIKSDDEMNPSNILETKSLFVYEKDCYYELRWDKDKKEIRFFQYATDGTLKSTSTEGDLLAQFVSSFSVDLRDVLENRTIKYSILLEKEGTGKEYSTSNKLKLRNEVLVNAALAEIYIPEEVAVIPDKILMSPAVVYAWPESVNAATGNVAYLSSTVTSSTGGVPSQNVIWTINGNDNLSDTKVEIQSAGSAKLTVGKDVLTDADHKFFVMTSKALDGGETLKAAEPGIEVLVRHLEKLVARDSLGNTQETANKNLTSGATGMYIQSNLSGYNLQKIADDGSHVSLSEAEKGGVSVAITIDGVAYTADTVNNSGVIYNVVIDEDYGMVSFDVNNVETDSKHTVRFEFNARRTEFNVPACVMEYTVQNSFRIEVSDNMWDRQDSLKLTFLEINEDWLTEDGYSLKGNNIINVTFRLYDDSTGITVDTGTFSNNANSAWGTSQVQYGSAIRLDTDTRRSINGVSLYLRGYEDDNGDGVYTPGLAYSYPYAPAGMYSQWVEGANKCDITVQLGDYAVQTVTVDILPVQFSYNRAYVDTTGWSNTDTTDASDNDTAVIYWTPDMNNATAYYQLLGGWENSDTNDHYTFKDRYTCILGDPANNLRYSYFNTEVGKDSEYYYVKLTLQDGKTLPAIGEEITLAYEYNPYFGVEVDLSPDSKAYYDRMKGCDGKLKIKFVEPNILTDSTFEDVEAPGVNYCPPPDNAEFATDNYYYFSNTRRFVKVTKTITEDGESKDVTALVLQTTTNKGSSWVEPWQRCFLAWDEENKLWVMTEDPNAGNIVIHDNRVDPGIILCPEPGMIKDEGFSFEQNNGYTYYIYGTNRTQRLLLTIGYDAYGQQEYYISYQEYRRVSWRTYDWVDMWGDAKLYWDETDRIWTHDINVKPGNNWSEPPVLYCPSPQELMNGGYLYRQGNNKYTGTYDIGIDEYYKLSGEKGRYSNKYTYYIQYKINDGRTSGWGQLTWNDSSKCWE